MKISDSLVNENLRKVKACLDETEMEVDASLLNDTWPVINRLRLAMESRTRLFGISLPC